MQELHKIRHVLPPNSWLAVYARTSEPWVHVIPLSDRALVTLVDRDGDSEEYQDAVVGFVAYGGYINAEQLDPSTGLIFAGYFNPIYEQAFPQFYDQLSQYLARIASFAQQTYGQPQRPQQPQPMQIPEAHSEPVMQGFTPEDFSIPAGEEQDVPEIDTRVNPTGPAG